MVGDFPESIYSPIFRMSSRSIKKLVLNPNAFSKPAVIRQIKIRAENSQNTKQSEEPVEFDSALQELPEFVAIQKQDEPSSLVQDPTGRHQYWLRGQSQNSQD